MLYQSSFRPFFLCHLICATALCVVPVSAAKAAAFYIQEQSVKSLGSAGAGSAALAEDASTIFFNPAGMTTLSGAQITFGAHGLKPSASSRDLGSTVTNANSTVSTGSDNGGNPFDYEAVPNAYFAYPVTLDNRLWLGLGISAPFGLANDYGTNWVGRYDSVKSSLKTIDIQPSIAYAVTPWLSIGGGVNVQYADAQLQSAIPVPSALVAPSPATDGLSDLSGDAVSTGMNAGILLTPAEGTKIGVHYRSAISHELDGRLAVKLPGGSGGYAIAGNVGLDLPDIATVSVVQQINDRLQLMASASWVGWNKFNSIPVETAAGFSSKTLNYRDTNSFSIGANYQLNPQWELRAGYQFDETPTNDTHRTTSIPDGDRNWFATGATYKASDTWEIDFAAVYVDVSTERINLSEAFTSSSAVTNIETSGDVAIFSVAATYKF